MRLLFPKILKIEISILIKSPNEKTGETVDDGRQNRMTMAAEWGGEPLIQKTTKTC